MFDPEFFPTPPALVHHMLTHISKNARYFLDPSAGKGDIASVIKKRDRWNAQTIDCIEQHPDLAALLREKDFNVVGYDWLTYTGVCYYDAILMNPPFSNGDAHLLKAWDFLHDGEIVCLLNAETLRNPYTERRQRLVHLINEHGSVEDLGACFTTAEHPTDVEVSLVYLKKVSEDDTIDLWHSETSERAADDAIGTDPQWLAIVDTLGNMEHYYNQANVHMFKALQHLRKAALYMQANTIHASAYDRIPGMALNGTPPARAEFARKHRTDAWMAVLRKMDFHQWLDKQQTEQFIRDVQRDGNIPFTKENIKGTLENIFVQRHKLFQISVAHVFDELTRYYKGNHAHGEGWKSNDNYKVNRKLVFPWGCSYDNKFCHNFELRYSGSDIDVYNDLDRVLCVLDGQKFSECYTIEQALRQAFQRLGHHVTSPFYNQAESQYFTMRFFKKGTLHLTFTSEKLWQDFNVTAAEGKRWLGMQTQRETEAAARAAADVETAESLCAESLSAQNEELILL